MKKRGRPIKWTDKKIEEINALLENYIEITDIPIVAEFAYINDITRQRLYEFAEQNSRFSDTMKKCVTKKEAQLERFGLLNVINPVMGIFSLKQLGWRDKVSIEGELGVKIIDDVPDKKRK